MVKTEIVQLRNICCTWNKVHTLDTYSLTICSGEILCVIGFSGSGKSALEKILIGEVPLTSGQMYLNGRRFLAHNPENAVAQGIYTIGTMNPMVMNLSIAENLSAVRHIPNCLQVYRRNQSNLVAEEILKELDLNYAANKPVAELSFLDECLLSIAKIVRSGAKLIILNCVHNSYSTREIEILSGYMSRWRDQGVSFLIICERVNPFFDIADKIQVISKGTDQYQWHTGTLPARQFRLQWDDISVLRDSASKDRSIHAICMLDSTRDSKQPFASYLQKLKRNNPKFWDSHIGAALPVDGKIRNGTTVIVPKESAVSLAENLSIADNLSLCIPQRVGRGPLQVIHRGMQQVLLRNFQEMIHIPETISRMSQLSEVQKKILSIHRWALSNPEYIILEDPFWGLDMQEMAKLQDYLIELSAEDIRLIVFIQNAAESAYFFGPLIVSDNGHGVRVNMHK